MEGWGEKRRFFCKTVTAPETPGCRVTYKSMPGGERWYPCRQVAQPHAGVTTPQSEERCQIIVHPQRDGLKA